MEKIPTTQSTHTNRGYITVMGSTLLLSTTAIFIRHLTQDYMLRLGDAWAEWFVPAALAVGPTLMGYGLYNMSLRYLPSSTVNLLL